MNMSVRAKFFVSKLDNPDGATAAQVHLGAVCRGVENSVWSQATPGGSIQMSVLNTPAYEQFEYGAEYIVTFEKVAKPAAGDRHAITPVADKFDNLVCEICGQHVGIATEERAKAYGVEVGVREETRRSHEEHYGKPAPMQTGYLSTES